MFIQIIVFLVVLSVLVLVHELGHFIAAKRAGLWVEEFGFGIPPRLLGKKIGETIYSFNLFPFGGFVRIHGESDDQKITNPKRAFLNQSKKTRSKIIVAGVFMNFVLAVVAFGLSYTVQGIPQKTGQVKVIEVSENSPAEKAGFEKDDVVEKVDGQAVEDNNQFIDILSTKADKETDFLVVRGSEEVVLSAAPRSEYPDNQGPLGIVITDSEIYYPPFWQRPFLGVYYGFKEALFWTALVGGGMAAMIANLFKGVVPKDVAGPVGIYALTAQAASFGFWPLVNFVGILSVNLMILNILPFPALDGGRLLFVFLEKVVGRKVLPKAEAVIHAVGLAILLLLLLAITIGDIKRLIEFGGISGFIDSAIN